MNKTTIIAEPGKQELFNVREFDAPCELVFRAFTDSALYRQWYGPKGALMTVYAFEARTGGSWRYKLGNPDGSSYTFSGVFHEVAPPERIIDTVELEGLPEKGHVILRTNRFEALLGDRTKLTMQIVAQSVADRDAMVPPSYEREVNESYSRLDELLEKIRRERK